MAFQATDISAIVAVRQSMDQVVDTLVQSSAIQLPDQVCQGASSSSQASYTSESLLSSESGSYAGSQSGYDSSQEQYEETSSDDTIV